MSEPRLEPDAEPESDVWDSLAQREYEADPAAYDARVAARYAELQVVQAAAEADMAARWDRIARATAPGPSFAELEEKRWGPGGRAHFADPRPGDYPGRVALEAQAEPEPELEAGI